MNKATKKKLIAAIDARNKAFDDALKAQGHDKLHARDILREKEQALTDALHPYENELGLHTSYDVMKLRAALSK